MAKMSLFLNIDDIVMTRVGGGCAESFVMYISPWNILL
jgi:hypothetical protein